MTLGWVGSCAENMHVNERAPSVRRTARASSVAVCVCVLSIEHAGRDAIESRCQCARPLNTLWRGARALCVCA